MDQSAFKKYLIQSNQFSPGDITIHSVVSGGVTFDYYKAGNLYFGFRVQTTSPGISKQILIEEGNGRSYTTAASLCGISAQKLATDIGALSVTETFIDPFNIFTGNPNDTIHFVTSGFSVLPEFYWDGATWIVNDIATVHPAYYGMLLYGFLAN